MPPKDRNLQASLATYLPEEGLMLSWGLGPIGFRGLGFRAYRFRGFRGLRFRVWGFRGLAASVEGFWLNSKSSRRS